MMDGVDEFELCRRLKADRATRLIPVVLVTALTDREHRIEGIKAGAADFLSKPVDTHELSARVQSLLRLKRFTDDRNRPEHHSTVTRSPKRAGLPRYGRVIVRPVTTPSVLWANRMP